MEGAIPGLCRDFGKRQLTVQVGLNIVDYIAQGSGRQSALVPVHTYRPVAVVAHEMNGKRKQQRLEIQLVKRAIFVQHLKDRVPDCADEGVTESNSWGQLQVAQLDAWRMERRIGEGCLRQR